MQKQFSRGEGPFFTMGKKTAVPASTIRWRAAGNIQINTLHKVAVSLKRMAFFHEVSSVSVLLISDNNFFLLFC